ncbi:STAS domain-containing protein [Embleya sp. NPDC005575]|uniref:STAS domain-containing protein n=1 Tax=Embleya sp. NPDC005575 TaxID=3156892 RepID=UPI0033A3DC12
MSEENLRIVVTTDPAGVIVASVAGELDIVSAEQLRNLLRRVLVEHTDIVLDLSEVTFCDCSGLRVLRAAGRAAEHAGTRLRLRSPSTAMDRILKATRAEAAFTIEPPPNA